MTSGIIFGLFALMVLFAAGMMLYSFLIDDTNNYTHIITAFISGIVYILAGYSAFGGIKFYGSAALLYTDQTAWIAMVFILLGVIMFLYMLVKAVDLVRGISEEI